MVTSAPTGDETIAVISTITLHDEAIRLTLDFRHPRHLTPRQDRPHIVSRDEVSCGRLIIARLIRHLGSLWTYRRALDRWQKRQVRIPQPKMRSRRATIEPIAVIDRSDM